jgi:hypothetical protein
VRAAPAGGKRHPEDICEVVDTQRIGEMIIITFGCFDHETNEYYEFSVYSTGSPPTPEPDMGPPWVEPFMGGTMYGMDW